MKLLIGGLFLLGVSSCLAQGRCPQEWMTFESKCYRFFNIAKTFPLAQRHCESLGAVLASVTSYAENQQIAYINPSSRTWLGAQRRKNHGSFYWLDGSRWGYTNWHAKEPNNLLGPENCLETNYNGIGHWNDVRCHREKPFICQRRK